MSEVIDTDSQDSASTTFESHLTVVEEVYIEQHPAEYPVSSAYPDWDFEVDPTELFPPALVAEHSTYADWEALAAMAPWDLTDRHQLATVPLPTFDEFLATETAFESAADLSRMAVGSHLNEGDT